MTTKTTVYAEFDEPQPLVRAIAAARAWGPVTLETYSPYPVHEIEHALAAKPSRLSIAVLAAGLGAAAGAYGLQWLVDGYLYPLDVGNRPPHFPLAFVPITFEMGVLFAALTALASVLVGARLLRLWDPSREVEGIESATSTHFWLEITVPHGSDVDALIEAIRETEPLAVRRREVS